MNTDSIILPVVSTFLTETVWVNPHPTQAGIAQIDTIPLSATCARLWDWVRWQYTHDGQKLFVEVVQASGYRTLRIEAPERYRDPSFAFARYRIAQRLNQFGLEYERNEDEFIVAVPPSYSAARLALLRLRCPGFRFEGA